MTYLLSGSLAYDSILLHEGHFHARIFPESLSRLNVAFGVDEDRMEFGGTGGNIAYNASLLEENIMLCSSVGHDFHTYQQHLEKCGISTQYLTHHDNTSTAHAWVLTDKGNNQITGFKLGAMKHTPNIPPKAYQLKLWHLAPDSAKTTAVLAKEAINNNIDYFLDPGQTLPGFLEGKIESIIPFEEMIQNAKGLFVNEYESHLLQDKIKKPLTDFFQKNLLFIIETLGSKGLIIHTKAGKISIPVAKANKIVDPTGCGDAFRAGFIFGYTKNWDLKFCAELGAVMASFVIENYGGQNHKPSYQKISDRLNDTFGWKLEMREQNGIHTKQKNSP